MTALFATGCAVGASLQFMYFRYQFISVDLTFTLGNVLQAGATVGAAIYVGKVINKQLQVLVKEKEFFAKSIDTAETALNEFENATAGPTAHTEVAASHKKLSVSLSRMVGVLKAADCPPKIIDGADFTAILNELLELATELPLYTKMDEHAKTASDNAVVNGILTITAHRKKEIDNKIQVLRERLVVVRLQVNQL